MIQIALTGNMRIDGSTFFVKSGGCCSRFTSRIKVLLATKFLARKLPYG
jgi:hypothetical protein